MKINLSIRARMLVVMLLIFIITFVFIGDRIVRNALEGGKGMTDAFSREYANASVSRMNTYMDVVRTIGHAFETYRDIPEEERRPFCQNILKKILQKNEDILSLWTIWEPMTIDSLDASYVNKPGSTHIGNFSPTFYKEGGVVKLEENQGQSVLFVGDYFTIPKANRRETILEPYFYSYTGSDKDNILMTSLIYPIIIDGKFLGVIGADVSLDVFCKTIPYINFMQGSKAFLISNQGFYVAHHDRSLLGKSVAELHEKDNLEHRLVERIKNGDKFSMFSKDNGFIFYSSFAPVSVGETTTPWSIEISVPRKTIFLNTLNSFSVSIIIGIIGFILLSFSIKFIADRITNSLASTSVILEDLAHGDIDLSKKIEVTSTDEIGEISNSVNKLIDGLNSKVWFAKQIGEENLEVELELQSERDVLGGSLLEMRKNLKQARDLEIKRKVEDERRNWTNQGVAKFGEILRKNNDNLKALGHELISNLVKYTNANQGGFYLIDEEDERDKYIKLVACFAYDRRKYHQQRINWGEGLIGACILEKQYIYIIDIPDDYISITSGLGDANPSSILIVPLKVNDGVQGAIELASFNKLEKFEIEFIERIAESIASTISSVKINIRTAELLEKSQQYAEEMAMKEEEMRQNIEELQATQEEAARREEELKKEIYNLKS